MSGEEPELRRWALMLEYDGSPYVGWQRQATGLSVQQVVEEAASHLAFGRTVACSVAGRTDAGVHAAGQVASLELPEPKGRCWDEGRLRDALNFHLKPHPIVALRVAPVTGDWHPRFSAILRRYRYQILNRRARPALSAGRVWHVERPLDLGAMAQAAASLLGRHDFSTFRAAACQAKSPVRTLDRLDVSLQDQLLVIEAEARSFLHHQVRNMVGTLALVGAGRWTPAQVDQALAARDRRRGGPTAPAEGLTLIGVGYPASPFDPAEAVRLD